MWIFFVLFVVPWEKFRIWFGGGIGICFEFSVGQANNFQFDFLDVGVG
jgi:hypothetical protein